VPKFFVLFVVGLIIAGCAQSSTNDDVEAYHVLDDAQINVGDTVPSPSGDVILTITGRIHNKNVGDNLQFDMETLEQLGLIEYSVDDQQAEGRVVTFQGVLLSKVLEVAGIDEEATSLKTIALNDYAIDIPLSDATDYPVMIATSVDGERMTIERYGPTRIIYPYESYEFDVITYDPRWIWQLSTIIVE